MLDVQQVRLRFIFVRALYLYCLFQKAYGRAIYPYAVTENNPRRIRTAMDGGVAAQQRVCAANT